MNDTSSHAFFFNANAEGTPSFYGGVFDPAFLKALAAADPTGSTSSCVLRGDLLIEALCRRVTSVSNSHKNHSWVQGYDMELYRTVIWDQADAWSQQWRTVDLGSFPLILAQNRVYCIVLPSLPTRLRERVDKQLRTTGAYLGGLEIDHGNPIQYALFIHHLIDSAFVMDGAVYLERGWDGVDDTLFEGASDFSPRGEQRLGPEEFELLKPAIPRLLGISDRGRLSAERYEGKRTYTIEERVIQSLAQLRDTGKTPFAFKSSQNANALLEADLPEAKFIRYLLNPDHKDGAGKAKFFHEVLGIDAADWRYLAAQFYEGLRRSSLSDLKIKTWDGGIGASFNCVLPITGLNGRVARVFTNWIMRPGQLPQLSTARPEEDPNARIDVSPTQPNIVSTFASAEEQWKELYRIAHAVGTTAWEQCVPTPIRIKGFGVEMEGLCGSASIRIPDARRDFARWVVRSKIGSRHYRGGADIFVFHPSQSIDRATAYAKAFAAVLELNGIQCTVESLLD
jgi:hypothetical protein